MEPLDIPEADMARLEGTAVGVHAGFPNPAADRAERPLSLDKLLIRHPNSTYFFRIRGHHWWRHGVFDGDLVLVDRALSPRVDHDLIVWWEESGEFALSRFNRLEPAPVWGTVTAVVHSFGTPQQ